MQRRGAGYPERADLSEIKSCRYIGMPTCQHYEK
jgi:hypothetical protein